MKQPRQKHIAVPLEAVQADNVIVGQPVVGPAMYHRFLALDRPDGLPAGRVQVFHASGPVPDLFGLQSVGAVRVVHFLAI